LAEAPLDRFERETAAVALHVHRGGSLHEHA
jgi:hypothetical protein